MTHPSLLTLEFADLTAGYRGLDLVSRFPNLRIVEAGPLAQGRFFIFAEGKRADLDAALVGVRKHFVGNGGERLLDDEISNHGHHPQILEALFSLAQTPLEKGLLVVETETVSAMMSAAEVFLEDGLRPIEIKLHRSSHVGAHAFFTGEVKLCANAAETARTRLRGDLRECRIEVIDDPTENFRRFFS